MTLRGMGARFLPKWYDDWASVPHLAMPQEILHFTVSAPPSVVSRTIEQYAAGQGRLNALVVPWESDPVTLSMAVTAVKSDGWAIEHTNLGTIRLTDLGNDLTLVDVVAHEPNHAEKQKLVMLFDAFARNIESMLKVKPQA